ncbi:MAG: hypothetical protein LUE21_02485 [Oscillospiraceae bacterium]|nr:hypothetical protein [Oscillospiraceae bacterium]
MIVAEVQTEAATVRIHDEFFTGASQGSLDRISQIIVGSYKRRTVKKDKSPSHQ